MKVSVICMAYNHEKYIANALEGFVSQKTNFDYEVLINDDASTDRTASIIAEYAQRYPEIIKPVYQKKNLYSTDTDIILDILLPLAKGKYLAFCEGDDYWTDENKLQLQVDFLDAHPEYIACVHNTSKLEMMTNKETVMYGTEDYDITTPDVLKGGSCCYHTSSRVCRREALTNLPPFLPYIMDYPMAIHLSLLGPIRFMGRIMSVYRVGTESSWTTSNRRNMHRNAIFHKQVSHMLRQVNEYTNFAYNAQIKDLVLYNDYKELYFDEKYTQMRQPEFRVLYEQESVSARVKMRLKQYFAPLYHLYRRIKY